MKIKVVESRTGKPGDYGKALIRNVLRLVDWLPFLYLVGGILVLVSERRQRLGDLVAGTVVVKA